MKIKALLQRGTRDQNILLLAVAAAFLPFALSVIATVGVTVYILAGRERRRKCASGLANLVLFLFCFVTLFVGFIYENWFGMAVSVYFCGLILILNFAAAVATKVFYIRVLRLVTYLGVLLSFATFAEKMMVAPLDPKYRCVAYCGNPNYLAALLVVVILCCAYLEMSREGRPLYCYGSAALCGAALWLTGSMFAWVEIFAGLAILLLLMKRHITLSFLFLFAAAFCLILLSSPDLLPRFGEAGLTTHNRMAIWKTSIAGFFEHPWFGQGFYSYKLICRQVENAYQDWHAHNLILESLISFGVVGSLLLGTYFLLFFRRFSNLFTRVHDKGAVACFPIALVGGALIHGMVDLTFLWVQTGLIAVILLGGGFGASYRTVKEV